VNAVTVADLADSQSMTITIYDYDLMIMIICIDEISKLITMMR